MLKQLGIDSKDVRVIRNLYWEQTAAVKLQTDLSQFIKIQWVRQGCVFSPDLFNLYSEMIPHEIKDFPGIIVGG